MSLPNAVDSGGSPPRTFDIKPSRQFVFSINAAVGSWVPSSYTDNQIDIMTTPYKASSQQRIVITVFIKICAREMAGKR